MKIHRSNIKEKEWNSESALTADSEFHDERMGNRTPVFRNEFERVNHYTIHPINLIGGDNFIPIHKDHSQRVRKLK